jgi:hypothetical protein
MKYLNPNDIESINSIKRTQSLIAAIQDRYISVLKSNKYIFLTLEQIKSEYTKVKTDVIYMVNGEFIKENIDTFKLDRNYILKVEVTNSDAFYNLRKSEQI